MTQALLPAQSYEEALPFLRAPYQPKQVRAVLIDAPDNPRAPCSIALYAIGETAMDRFNLVCAKNWSRRFETVNETERSVDGKTFYYCEVRAIVVAFGEEHDDIGDAVAESHGAAMMNARAQAWKRGGRWHGPGQCLYAAEQILLWRSDKDDELFLPKSREDAHKHPYMKQGGQERCRHEYEKWLEESGISIFGKPLDHLDLFRQITRASIGQPAGEDSLPLPPAPIETQRALSTGPAVSTARDVHDRAGESDADDAPAPAPASSADTPAASAPDVVRIAMPDEPAAPETVSIAESINLTADVAQRLSNLARDDGQTGGLNERQQRTVLNWLVLISDVKLSSEEVVKAIKFLAGNGTCQEARRVHFTRWLAVKTSGGSAPDARTQDDPAAVATGSPPLAPNSPDAQPTDGDTSDGRPEVDDTVIDRALMRVNRAMASHDYSDRTVTQLAALAVGVGPRGKVDWGTIPPQTMQVLAELLESAGSLEWTPDLLAKEVLQAHNSTHQATAAGRFSAFAGHLTDLAESRSVEAA